MKVNKILISSFVFIIANSFLVSSVYAVPFTPNPTKKAQRQENVMTIKRTRADQEIDRRVKALNDLIGRINNMKKVSSDQKSSLVSQINSQISTLQTLKSKIDADTDPAVLKSDKQSIVFSYRIFALFVPKVRIMAHADQILEIASEMKTKTTNQDALNKISDAEKQANDAISTVSGLDPTLYPGNKSSLDTARQMLKTGRDDLRAARKLIKSAS